MSARRSWRVRKNGYQPAVEDRFVEHGERFEDGAVERFQGPHKFLSNFFWSQLDYEGLCYPSVEHAFQAAKLRRNEERLAWGFTGSISFGEAKRLGRQVVGGGFELKLENLTKLIQDSTPSSSS
ncbi:ybiA [Symbiodinium sp. CCMP2456]|nr:ybiA [Symbiodinium sp. CCMP2456]